VDGKTLGLARAEHVTGAQEVVEAVGRLLHAAHHHAAGLPDLAAVRDAVLTDLDGLLEGRQFPYKIADTWYEITVRARIVFADLTVAGQTVADPVEEATQ